MRTAPTGPSNGMPESMSAAEAPLIMSTSCGLTRSAARTVPTTWTSLRNPSGKHGRSGRSVSRQVRIAASGALPSRRKNEPGILPAAYMRSSRSTVSGKKSAPSRTERDAVAVTRTTVSPMRIETAPSARPASFPVSRDRVLSVPLTGTDTVMASAMGCLLRGPSAPVGSTAPAPVPSGERRDRVADPGVHHRQLMPTCCRLLSSGADVRPGTEKGDRTAALRWCVGVTGAVRAWR